MPELQLNKEKTEVIAFGNKDEVLKVNAYLDSRGQTTKNQVRNLGVILETDLSFSSHVKAVTKSAYYHLKNIARIRCFVSSQDLEKLVHAFMLTEYKPNRPLRSVGSSQLEIPRVHTEQGESAFSYFAACSWNQLKHLNPDSTHLFSCAFVEWALCYVPTDCIMYNHFLFLTVLNSFKNILYIFLFYCCDYIYIFFKFLVFIIIIF